MVWGDSGFGNRQGQNKRLTEPGYDSKASRHKVYYFYIRKQIPSLQDSNASDGG
jgi:hypothetical protein